ncbi:hypothetical protein BP5796_03074 [Coleophoma crateriformis]|uniref:Heterokaryon incompatibility domain-containing protein n=1 Tax=Coleophoma crateriformis TaxID=565419 RepID=A0A3D8SM49_9HELO|nr:hypothetical protein BP5796_03074 [Coleophoma crateriformis]
MALVTSEIPFHLKADTSLGSIEFQYRPLMPKEIRLVILWPGSWDSKLKCSLLYAMLEEHEYDALSYTWGDPTLTSSILLDDREFRVTLGLEAALQHLRHPTESLTLWIDAICINQSNIPERNSQVQMMYTIFQNAENVRSWIGGESEDGDRINREKLVEAINQLNQLEDQSWHGPSSNSSYDDEVSEWSILKLLETFGTPYISRIVDESSDSSESEDDYDSESDNRSESGDELEYDIESRNNSRAENDDELEDEGWSGNDSDCYTIVEEISESEGSRSDDSDGLDEQTFSKMTNSLTEPSGLKAWISLVVLCMRPYWARVWVQQEILQRSKVIIHFGLSSISLLSLVALLGVTTRLYQSDIDKDSNRYKTIEIFAEYSFLVQDSTSPFLAKKTESGLKHGGLTKKILTLLKLQFFKRSTDPRDKIYGLVGFIPAWRDGNFPIDYSLPVEKAYVTAIKHIVQTSGSLMMLVDTIQVSRKGRLAALPSWCPDWSFNASVAIDDFLEIPQLLLMDFIFDLRPYCLPGQSSTSNASFTSDDRGLIVSGCILDVVEHLVDRYTPTEPYLESKVFEESLGLALRYCGGPYWQASQNSPPDSKNHESTADIKFGQGLMGLSRQQINSRLISQLVAFWETVIGDHDQQFEGNNFDWITDSDLPLQEWIHIKTHIMQRVKQFTVGKRVFAYFPALPMIWNRRFFMSRQKYMGSAPQDAAEGDLVCIIFGTNVPVLLRPSGDHFVFIGPVYFHGWMTRKSRRLGRELEKPVQDFVIY